MIALLLSAAIASEVVATVSLKASDGFSNPLPSVVTVVGYVCSFYLLSLVLRDLSVGTTYAIWAAVGTAAVAVIGIAVYGEAVSALKIASLGLIVLGVIGLNAAGAH